MKKRTIQLTLAACLVIAGGVICAAFMKNQPPVEEVDFTDAVTPKKTDAPEGMVALQIELPESVLGGTRQPVIADNLEPKRPEGQMRPAFYVPVETVNAALNKPVTSTSLTPIFGTFEDITNGDKSGETPVELDPYEQNITIDLGASYEIYAIVLWHNFKIDVAYFDVVVQTADDPDFIMNVNTVFNNDIDNSFGLGTGEDKNYIETYEGKLIDAKGVRGRYVRFYGNGNSLNDMNHYIEAEVYGKETGQ